MPFLRALLLISCFAYATSAQAGPWLRAKGETFLSFSIETDLENGITDGSGLYGTLYLEHGLTDRLTLGVDAGGDDTTFSKAIGFLRWPLGQTDQPLRMAGEFGIGLADDDFAFRPGFSIGKGIDVNGLPGWLTLDSRALFTDGFDGLLETDLTLGLKPDDRTMLILQLQTGVPWDADAFAKLAPSYVRQLKPGQHIEVGLVAGVAEADDFKLKIGFWRSF